VAGRGPHAAGVNNIEIIERIYAAFARRDLAAVLAELAPDVTLVQEAPLPWGGTYTGRDGAAAFLGNLLAHLEPRLEIDELIPSGDYVVQIGHTSGRVVCTGKPFRAREVHVWRLSGGLVSSYQVHIDVPRMLDALA
jgi:ketosteroid isomerase-like protein